VVSSKKPSLTDSEPVTSEPDFEVANPDAELSDAAISALASLLLAAIAAEEVDEQADEHKGMT
jgi:hypothetical protein